MHCNVDLIGLPDRAGKMAKYTWSINSSCTEAKLVVNHYNVLDCMSNSIKHTLWKAAKSTQDGTWRCHKAAKPSLSPKSKKLICYEHRCLEEYWQGRFELVYTY